MPTILSLIFAALLLIPTASQAGSDLEKDFRRTGQHESLITSWSVFGGTTTSQRWSRLVEVIVSGFGVNVPASGFLEDSFYPINPATPDVPYQGPGVLPPQGLHLSFTGCAATSECGAPRIESFLVYVDNVGFVQPPATTIEAFLETIPYSPEHVYHIVIDVGSIPQFLTLGHGDGGVSDNSGHFAIRLFSVERTKQKAGRD